MVVPLLNDGLVEISAVAVPDGGERVVVNPGGWLVSPNPYSYGIKSGNTLFLAGLISRNGHDNSAVQGDMAAQTKTVMDNGAAVLDGRRHEPRRRRQLACLHNRALRIPGHERGVPDVLSGGPAGARHGQGTVDLCGLQRRGHDGGGAKARIARRSQRRRRTASQARRTPISARRSVSATGCTCRAFSGIRATNKAM